ncbi:MAG: ATP-dependent Clp protease ATP-binding subunit [Patescibacteria group bacterium]
MASSFFFDIKNSQLAQALWFDSYFHTALLTKIQRATRWVFLLFALLFLLTFIPEQGVVSLQQSRMLLGFVFLTFAYGTSLFLLQRFGESLKKTMPLVAKGNLAEFLSFESLRATHSALKYAERERFFALDSATLLYFLLKENPSFESMLTRMLLDPKELETTLKQQSKSKILRLRKTKELSFAPDFQLAITKAIDLARAEGREKAEVKDLLSAIAYSDAFFKQYLIERNFLPERDIPNIAKWHYQLYAKAAEQKKFWLKKNLRRYGALGKDWASGYTITLDQFGYDISKEVMAARFPRAIGHHKEKEAIERILSRQQTNNVLLIGNPGSGRRRLIQDLASKSVLGENQNPFLNYRRVVELNLAHLVASIQALEEAEAILSEIFGEVIAAGNIILVLDDVHNFVGEESGQAAGRMNIAGVLSSYLRLPQFPFIAITTFAGLHRYLEQNPSLLSLFEQVEVTELSQAETLEVLQETVPAFEGTYKKFISYPALQTIVAYADKYIQAVPFPKKAVDLLDDAMSWLAQTSDKVLLPKHVAAVVTERTQIPVGDIETTERETLLSLENLIHKRIVNQQEAVKEIAGALRRARAQVTIRSGPMGSFLFLGPTGVGKTETAKALAAIYFGSESRMIRLDMSEFQNVKDIERLLGTPTQQGLLTTAIRQDPFSLLLLDELEKAHPNILNLFLQVLDEGHITDGLGRKTDFRHTIIIATSNAGYQLILQAIKQEMDFAHLKEQMLDFLFQEGIYRPEFLNRFDGVVLFAPLTQEHLLQIAGLMLKKLQSNMMTEKGIELEITEDLKAKIAELGYDPKFGARNMRRVLSDKVENALAVALLSNAIKRGDRITVDANTFEVKKM